MNDLSHHEEIGMNSEWLRDVRRIYLSGSSRKLAELERAITGLEMNPASSSHERRLRRLLHNLIGSGASYGFQSITDIARDMSECLKRKKDDHSPISSEVLTDLKVRLDHLRSIFANSRA